MLKLHRHTHTNLQKYNLSNVFIGIITFNSVFKKSKLSLQKHLNVAAQYFSKLYINQ